VSKGDLPKRIISEIYSRTAGSLYEPIVVRGTFRMFSSDLEKLVLEQGRRAIAAAGGGPILDLPVGTGHFTTKFASEHDGLIVGADIAHGMVVKTTRTAAEAGQRNLVAVRADAHALPFATGSFAAAMCSNGLQVMPGLKPTLAELHRVIKQGGSLQVSIVNVPLGAALPEGASHHLPTMFKSRASMIDAIRGAGFTIADVATSRLATLVEAQKGAN
jgi:ubiquinone/menaquinone biosynthesis C-methylase UbiE